MSWADFSKAKKVDQIEDIDIQLSSLFSSDIGKEVMLWLRQKTKETYLSADISESALREHVGRGKLVHEIELRIARARKHDVRDTRADYYRKSSPRT